MRDGQPKTTSIEQLVGRIDRRIVYLGLFLVTLAPLVAKWALPLYVSPPPKMLAQAIDALPPDKLVILCSNWDAGTQAENRPQLIAIARHLIRRNLRFAVMSIGTPNAPQLAHTAIQQAIRLENAQDRWLYERDWVNLGFKIANAPWLRTFARDIQEAMKEDWKGKPLAQIPLMRNVRKFGPPDDPNAQVSMLIDITGSATIDAWIQYLSPTKTKLGLACTAVMAPEQYPFLDSGQLVGMLTGMKGAAEYEQLIKAPGLGLPAMAGQSFAHLYILLLIALGNLSVFLGWRQRRSGRRGAR